MIAPRRAEGAQPSSWPTSFPPSLPPSLLIRPPSNPGWGKRVGRRGRGRESRIPSSGVGVRWWGLRCHCRFSGCCYLYFKPWAPPSRLCPGGSLLPYVTARQRANEWGGRLGGREEECIPRGAGSLPACLPPCLPPLPAPAAVARGDEAYFLAFPDSAQPSVCLIARQF